MPPGPSLAPGSSPYLACLLTNGNGHTKYLYLFYHLGHLSSGFLSSEAKILFRLSWILTWERPPGLWGGYGLYLYGQVLRERGGMQMGREKS